jgi:hypothetical protein
VTSELTDDKTGEVNDINDKNDKENTKFETMDKPIINQVYAVNPVRSNLLISNQSAKTIKIHKKEAVTNPINEAEKFENATCLLDETASSGGHTSFLYSTSYSPYKTAPNAIITSPQILYGKLLGVSSESSWPE